MLNNLKFSVVVVFFNPTDEHIEHAMKLAETVKLIIVDNSPSPRDYVVINAEVIKFNQNKGIATAINEGLINSIKSGYDYTLLLDQDSEPDVADLYELINSAVKLNCERNNKVAAVSPAYYDRAINKRCDFLKVEGFKLKRVSSIGNKPINVSYTITSGTVIKLACLEYIGLMDDSLFIDFVDIEWCFRATNAGYEIIGIPNVLMEHEIGCEPVVVFGKKYVNHSPIRHYYYFRNAILLMRRTYVPFAWKKNETLKILPRFIVYSLFTNNKFEHLKKMSRGIIDGLKGRVGGL